MTWKVPYRGEEYDIDPTALDMAQWDDIAEYCGLKPTDGLGELLSLLGDQDRRAWRALFAAAAGVPVRDFRGPDFEAILYALTHFPTDGAIGQVAEGKDMPAPESTTSEPSPSSTPGAAPPSSTG